MLWFVTAGLGGLLIIGSVFPVPELISSFTLFGYGITHDLWVIGYFVFTYFLIHYFRSQPKPYRRAVLITAGVGIGSELVQFVTPFRVFDIQDIYLNLFGVSLILFDRHARGLQIIQQWGNRYANTT